MRRLGTGVIGRGVALAFTLATMVACGDNGVGTLPPSLLISTDSVTVAEGGTTTFTVGLSDPLTIDGAVQVTVADGSAATVSPQVITFAAGDTAPKTITVTGSQDSDLAAETSSITLSAADINAGTVALSVTDDDTQAIVTTTTAVNVGEGSTATLGVHLAFVPAADTTVSITPADTARLGASPTSLTFTAANYAADQTITLTAAQDADVVQNTVVVAFASSGLSGVNVTVTIADNDVQGIATSMGSLALVEANTPVPGTFQVTLNQQPSADVVINLASTDTGAATVSPATLTFTAANYNLGSAHVVTVTPVSDNNTANESLNVTLNGGGLSATVPVTVTDDDVQSIVAPATVTVAEGGSSNVAVSLAFDPGAQVTVNVASADTTIAGAAPATLTFDSTNFSLSQNVAVSGTPDTDIANETTSLTLTSTGITTGTVAVTVTDDDTQAIQLNYAGSPGSLTLPEGTSAAASTAQVGVRLAFMPAAPVTVMVVSNNANLTVSTSMLTFQPAQFATEQFVTLTALDETDLINDTAIVAFSATGTTTRNLNVDIPDTDVQGFFVTPTTLPTINEGTSTTFQVRLNFAPSAPVTANITSSNSKIQVNGGTTTQVTIPAGNTLQTVTVTVTQDPDAVDESATITISDAALTIPSRTLSATGNDDEIMSFVVTPATMDIDGQRLDVIEEGAPVTFQVRLSAAPTADTTVTITPSSTNTVEVSNDGTNFTAATTLTFTPASFGNQTITVRGIADPNLVDEVFTVAISGPGSLGAPDAFVYMRKIENDAQAIVTMPAQPGPLNVTEGTTSQVAVRLQFQPVQSVQITLTPSTSDILLAGASAPVTLLFTTTNYDVPQLVNVTTPQDADQFDDVAGTITVSSPALASHVINVNLFDEDDQTIILSAPSITINEPNTLSLPSSGTFTVRLGFIPTEVTETITLTVPAASVDKIDLCDALGNNCGNTFQLTFSNVSGPGGWDQAQTVTVKSETDIDVENHTIAVALTSNRAPFATNTFTVSVVDDDQLNVIVTPGLTGTVDEPGGSIAGAGSATSTFSATLNFSPTTDLVVDLTSLNTAKVTVSPATLTFTATNFGMPQMFTVTAVADDDVRNEAITVNVTSARTPTVALAITVRDFDQQAFVQETGLQIIEGSNDTMTLRLAQEPTADVTVLVATTITDETVLAAQTILVNGQATATLTFTPANWNANQTVTVSSPEDLDLDHFSGTVTATVTSGQTLQELAAQSAASYSVRDNDTQAIVVSSDPAGLFNSAQEGGPYVKFQVHLTSRPRLTQQDTVRLTAPGNIRFYQSGTNTLDLGFGAGDFGVDQEIRWYLRDGGSGMATDFTSAITMAMVNEENDQVAPFGLDNVNDTDAQAVRGLDDDDQQIVDRIDYPTGFNGATNFTQRSNVAFGLDGSAEGVVAFTARSAPTGGNAVLGFTNRVLGTTTTGPQFATGGTDPTTEIVLFDADEDGAGPDVAAWNVFSSATQGIIYARFDITGATLVAPTVVAPATDNVTDFSVARNDATSVYGVIYRRETVSRNNLYFRTVAIATGLASGEQISTTANSFVHFHPTLLYVNTQFDPGTGLVDAPYTALYSENGTTKLVRLTATGAPLGSYTFGSEFSGDFSSSVYVSDWWIPAIYAANVRQTGPGLGDNAVFLHVIVLPTGGQAAGFLFQVKLTTAQLAPISPPFIAVNRNAGDSRGDLAVAYDSGLGGTNQVGVALFNPWSGPRDYRLDQVGDEGLYPSLAWAYDRWVLRYQATSANSTGIRVRTGSFEGNGGNTTKPVLTTQVQSGPRSLTATSKLAN